MYGLAMARGLLVTLKNMTKKPFTIQYPEERVKQHPRFRGEEFVWYEERCTGCASCAKYCPLGIIKIVTSPSESAPRQGDKYKLEVFDIELQRCMFCGSRLVPMTVYSWVVGLNKVGIVVMIW